ELVTRLPPSKGDFTLCQFTPDGLLALTDGDRTELYDIPSGKVARTWPVGRIARLTRDAKTFVRIEKEFETISIGDMATRVVTSTLAVKTADNGVDHGLAFSVDGRLLAAVHDCRCIQIWDTATQKKQGEVAIYRNGIDPDNPYYAVSFSPDGQAVILATRWGR